MSNTFGEALVEIASYLRRLPGISEQFLLRSLFAKFFEYTHVFLKCFQNLFISPPSEDECDIGFDDNEHCQDNSSLAKIEVEFPLVENQIEIQAAEISSSPGFRTQNRFDQSFSLHPQVDDDWEKMYLDDDGIFIDDNSSCNSSFGDFEIQNGVDEVQIDGSEYEKHEEYEDGQENIIQAADFVPVLPSRN